MITHGDNPPGRLVAPHRPGARTGLLYPPHDRLTAHPHPVSAPSEDGCDCGATTAWASSVAHRILTARGRWNALRYR